MYIIIIYQSVNLNSLQYCALLNALETSRNVLKPCYYYAPAQGALSDDAV